jgi:hypothetical protein
MTTSRITSRHQADEILLAKAAQDAEFRRELLADPRAAIKAVLGVQLPADIQVTVLEETDRNLYLVLPAKASDELSDEELDQVTGGATGGGSKGTVLGTIFGGARVGTSIGRTIGTQGTQGTGEEGA